MNTVYTATVKELGHRLFIKTQRAIQRKNKIYKHLSQHSSINYKKRVVLIYNKETLKEGAYRNPLCICSTLLLVETFKNTFHSIQVNTQVRGSQAWWQVSATPVSERLRHCKKYFVCQDHLKSIQKYSISFKSPQETNSSGFHWQKLFNLLVNKNNSCSALRHISMFVFMKLLQCKQKSNESSDANTRITQLYKYNI